MRAYSVPVAALALETDSKWLDNVLSHHTVRGVERKRQGIQRKIPAHSLLILAIAQELIAELALPIRRALELADSISRSADGQTASGTVTIHADTASISARLNARLADAIEGAPDRPRGRPGIPKEKGIRAGRRESLS